MKGILTKKINGSWVVRVESTEQHECSFVVEHGQEFPLHPEDVKICGTYGDYSLDWEDKEVEFCIVHKVGKTKEEITTYAMIVKPDDKKINIEKMPQSEWDEARNTAYKHFDIDDLPTTTSDLIDRCNAFKKK